VQDLLAAPPATPFAPALSAATPADGPPPEKVDYVRGLLAEYGIDAPADLTELLAGHINLWQCRVRVEKYDGDWTADDIASGRAGMPREVVEERFNLLAYGGASNLWECLVGNGTGTAGQTLTFFNNGNAYIGVGDSSTVAAATQTDLQASTNKTRVAQDATYPQHTDGVVSGSASITWKSTFGTGSANYAWNEVALFNASTAGRMLNRLVQSLGTKSGGTWAISLTITLS
jgi:hypothetical protein